MLEIRALADVERIPAMKAAARAAEKKLVGYYCKSAYSKPVVMATVCDPRYKFDYFNWAIKHNVTDQDVNIQQNAYKTAHAEFTKYFEKRTEGEPVRENAKVSHRNKQANTKSIWTRARPSIIPTVQVVEGVPPQPTNIALETEFRLWAELISDDTCEETHVNVYEWWNDNKPGRPTWVLVAYDYAAIPAMSAEAERVFSRYSFNPEFD